MMEYDGVSGRWRPPTPGHSECQGNQADPFIKMDRASPGANVRAYYERFMYDTALNEYYGHSDFHNFGIWREGTNAASDACRALMRELITLSPRSPARVLEVGCGKGGTTRELCRHWPHANITGIDVSDVQLDTCRHNCPNASFMLMDACEMTFQASSVDLVISVEAAFHFPSRRRFLEHAHRVLAPGGRLVLQDVLHYKHDKPLQLPESVSDYCLDPLTLLPPENYLSGPEEYEALVHDIGFERCRIIDVTAEGPRQFYRHFLTHLADHESWGAYDPDHIRRLRLGARLFARKVNYCLLVSADAPS